MLYFMQYPLNHFHFRIKISTSFKSLKNVYSIFGRFDPENFSQLFFFRSKNFKLITNRLHYREKGKRGGRVDILIDKKIAR